MLSFKQIFSTPSPAVESLLIPPDTCIIHTCKCTHPAHPQTHTQPCPQPHPQESPPSFPLSKNPAGLAHWPFRSHEPAAVTCMLLFQTSFQGRGLGFWHVLWPALCCMWQAGSTALPDLGELLCTGTPEGMVVKLAPVTSPPRKAQTTL